MRAPTESTAARVAGETRLARAGLSTSCTTSCFSPRVITRPVKPPAATSRPMSRSAWVRSMTTLPMITSGATSFWLALEPKARIFFSRAAWNTPNPAASAFWKIRSAPRAICASACSLPALTSSQLPM